jgi:hypothetical protein
LSQERKIKALAERMGIALLSWARSSTPAAERIVEDRKERENLASILIKSSVYANEIFDSLMGTPSRMGDRARLLKASDYSSIMRKAATLRDSLHQTARLTLGEDLDVSINLSEPFWTEITKIQEERKAENV